METPHHTHPSEAIEKPLYEELLSAIDANREVINRIDELHSAPTPSSDPAAVEQLLEDFETGNRRLSQALAKWLTYIREVGRTD